MRHNFDHPKNFDGTSFVDCTKWEFPLKNAIFGSYRFLILPSVITSVDFIVHPPPSISPHNQIFGINYVIGDSARDLRASLVLDPAISVTLSVVKQEKSVGILCRIEPILPCVATQSKYV